MDKPFIPVVPQPFQAIYDQYCFAPAIVIDGVVHVSGQLGVDPASMTVPERLEDELNAAFDALQLIVETAGGSLAAIVSLTSYHVGGLADQMPTFIAVQSKRLGAPHPAWTAIGVSDLAIPGARVEISAIAHLTQR